MINLSLVIGLVVLLRHASSNKMLSCFSDAGVQLRCNGNVVSGATTNESGGFSMVLDPLQVVLSSLLSNCSLVVNTPLAKCNGKLPSMGSLISTLQFAGNTLLGILNVANIIPAGFHFMPQFNN